jgi:acetylornithine/succinyldiaminopimelate/putrescine aminotransferase
MTREIHSLFDTHPFIHISTFGGAEPGAAAALAVLDLVEAPGFLQHVTGLEQRFVSGLNDMPFTVRHLGLMMALAFPVPDAGMVAAKMLFDAGLFAIYANNDTSVLQFLPPLVTSEDETDEIIGVIRSVFG